MNIPTINKANEMFNDAVRRNPGAWENHSLLVADCASTISKQCKNLDADAAYIFGLLHDIGRREGITTMRHIYDGYLYLKGQRYDDAARICLTHSFPLKSVHAYSGENDCTKDETSFINDYLQNIEYSDYDKLIQLCDALAYPTGVSLIEKRLIDVTMRHGFNEYTLPKWEAFFNLKNEFDSKCNCNIYRLFDIHF
ncbi:HD domain-containing protein [Gorillibacterium timonense]|uniref:HD domain-containing protein n=1 Tax=Gorillibacterium timonense TaxID=1689269 RepID=UPI00071E2541|nr:HD domain-containing protein [Gorillibacterium timonense]